VRDVWSAKPIWRLAHGSGCIGTEHLLLGLVHDSGDAVAELLQALGVGPQAVRRRVEQSIERGHQPYPGHLPFAPATKKALERGLDEAQAWGRDEVDAEHILCGLTCEGESTAAQSRC
jgi:ATP-dependent Clp protease ATP-binding subunit ClpC